MRGDHGDDSDLDIAIVGGPWERDALDGAPHELGGAHVGWIPLGRKRFDPPPQVMCIPWVLMGQGVRLWGRALPETPSGHAAGSLTNVNHAYHDLLPAIEYLDRAARSVANAVEQARDTHSTCSDSVKRAAQLENAAHDSSVAAEFACKAALALHSVEPRRSHSVDGLCSALAERDPLDPLLAVMRPLDGLTKKAHESVRYDFEDSEPLERSVARAAGAMDAVAAIVTEFERSREDRPLGTVLVLDLRNLEESVGRVPEGRERWKLRSGFDGIEAAVRTARSPHPHAKGAAGVVACGSRAAQGAQGA